MNFKTYQETFDKIIEEKFAPYDQALYYDYAKMNAARSKRWLKQAIISDKNKDKIASISAPQKWIVITEHWCGDAAHIIPIIALLAQENKNITLEFQLRDQPPFIIDQYLTNGGKSIPKLVIRDASNNDIAVWGPRPKEAQALYDSLKAQQVDMEVLKTELQKWYNNDLSIAIQDEIPALL